LPKPLPPGSVPATEAAPPRQTPSLPPDDTLVTLDFKGGTIGDYVEAIRAATGATPVNILFNEETAKLSMYPVRLTNASVWSALSAVERYSNLDDGRMSDVRVNRPSTPPPGGVPTYAIVSQANPAFPGAGRSRQEMTVLSLNPIIGLPANSKADQPHKFDAKAVLSAVESAVGLVSPPEAKPPVLKFHEASGLLFVKGDDMQLRAAKEVVARMQEDVERERRISATPKPAADPVVTRRIAVAMRPDELPSMAENLKTNFGKQGALEIIIDGAFLVVTGPASLVEKVEENAKTWRHE